MDVMNNVATAVELAPRQQKRTRAQVYRERIQIRLAVDEAGPLIAEVLKENNIEFPGADWDSGISPHWVIACEADKVIGCVQIIPAKPFGWLEFLYTSKSAPYKSRVIAFRKLGEHGLALLKLAGCSCALGTVEPGNKGFLAILKKYNAIHVADVALMARRLK